MRIEKVTIKDNNHINKAEVPVPEGYTGSLVLRFHWRQGKLMRVDTERNAQVEIVCANT